MNALDTDQHTAPHPEAAQAGERHCPRCGAALASEQDWCLSCGAPASTRIAPPPGWRAPLAIVATVLLLAAAGLTAAFLKLTDDAERVAQSPGATPTAAAPTQSPVATDTPAASSTPSPLVTPTATPDESATPAATPTGTATPGGSASVASWPEGVEAWTVIILSSEDKAGARKRAEELVAAGTPVGLLNSSDYSSLRAGYWVVFSGQYDTAEEAQEAATGLGATAAGAYARLVKP
jgi:hypothetical protein